MVCVAAMKEKLHTLACMVFVLVIFTGCKGMGGFVKVAFAVAYVAAVAATHSSHGSSNDPPPEEPVATPTCDPGFVLRGDLCVPQPTFSPDAAAQSLARQIDAAQECRASNGPVGTSHARITFASSGEVTNVELEPPYAGTEVGTCVEKHLRRAAVPEYDGDPITVGKYFSIAP